MNFPTLDPPDDFSSVGRKEEEERRKAEEAAAKAALTAEEEAELANQPPPVLPYSSLFIFSSTNEFRCAIHAVVTFPLFDVFIMIVSISGTVWSISVGGIEEILRPGLHINYAI